MTESFLPRINGVTNSVCRLAEHLAARRHEVLIVAPAPGPARYADQPVELVPGVRLPFYRSFPVGLPTGRLHAALRDFAPDVVHLASPFVLGAGGLAAARRLDVPTVAVFQTDLAGFARGYGLGAATPLIWGWLCHLHRRADRTLAPSTPVLAELERRGVPRLALWARGVDHERFHPRHRSASLRARLAPDGEALIGYVGRLAAEKRPDLLAHLSGIPGARLVVVGDGPERQRLQRMLPDAVFAGFRTGRELSELVASMDVFVHTGAHETFCQAVQEGLASGVPVVAPAAGGPLDLVQAGHNGLLYAPDDGAELRAAVHALVADPVLRMRMSRNAHRSTQGRGWDVICDQAIGHYTEVMYGTTPHEQAA
ncbi:glycosyltransferase family 4 protein [Thermomonospora cellulosilytica]|uniref:Phosphatidylinositol alpha 1,6-mannosyltransferase n=1 Tax=Thermomonospora cellulosilytica TaxID=1411118 RepID=A0A7W3R9U8_9ACTN|nr:glycosyltransferase family 1 protein [Thermomonospora cellulosilytica]MBA9004695.1 phosphatidylinositol alpha 1,6-mannosyltransferase [Thermomonospora cellulosilytica]